MRRVLGWLRGPYGGLAWIALCVLLLWGVAIGMTL